MKVSVFLDFPWEEDLSVEIVNSMEGYEKAEDGKSQCASDGLKGIVAAYSALA